MVYFPTGKSARSPTFDYDDIARQRACIETFSCYRSSEATALSGLAPQNTHHSKRQGEKATA